MPPSRVKEEPQVRNESGIINVNDYQNTSITSPMRRIPSFINDDDDVEEEECDMLNGKVDYKIAFERTVKSSPSGQNKRKRNHPTEVLENEFGQLNRIYEDQFQKKRILNKDTSGSSPLRKKSSKLPINDINVEIMRPSWNTRIRKLRPIINEHRRNLDFEAWSREIWGLGSWWLEVAGEEVAGIVADLIDEFKREFSQVKGILMIPIISGNLHLDQLLAKSLTLLGKHEQAHEVCKLTLKAAEEKENESKETEVIKTEIKFLQGCLSRALGNVAQAIESFESVLKVDSLNSEAHDHLYGLTTGLLPYRPSGDSDEDALVDAYRKGNYRVVVEMSLDCFWTRWLGEENVLVLLASALACNFDSSALYTLGQRSVNQRPEASVTWYCVGLFYQVTGRSEEARRYLFKAGIGSTFKRSGAPDCGIGPSWIALGHSFAAFGDHDQAVSAYVAAVRTHCPGSVEPSLFLAIEYLRVRQPVLAAAYLLDSHAADPNDPRVLNELACLQAGKNNFSTAKKFLSKAFERVSSLPLEIGTALALNFSIVSVKEVLNDLEIGAEDVKKVLNYCVEEILGPLLNSVKKSIQEPSRPQNNLNPSAFSLFPWTENSAHPSAEHGCLFIFCVLQEWRALFISKFDSSKALKFIEESLEGYRTLLECRNEHRNLGMEAVLIERQHRLLSAHSSLAVNKSKEKNLNLQKEKKEESDSNSSSNFNFNSKPPQIPSTFPIMPNRTPRTPLIRSHSHSLAFLDSFSNNTSSNSSFLSSSHGTLTLQTPLMSFSAGALPTASALGLGSALSSIAASVSRRRLSLRRQMTGLRFDPTDTSVSFSSLESDNSFTGGMDLGLGSAVTSTQLNEDLMSHSMIIDQSMILIDDNSEADCELNDGEIELNKNVTIVEEDFMRLDSD